MPEAQNKRPMTVNLAPTASPEVLRVRWGGGRVYKLIELGDGATTHALPGKEVYLEDHQLADIHDVLLICERAAGAQDFQEWLCGRLLAADEGSRRWIRIDAGAWKQEFFAPTGAKSDPLADSKKKLEEFGRAEKAEEKARVLVQWNSEMSSQPPLHVFVRNLDVLAQKAVETTTAFRIFREAVPEGFLHLISASASDTAFFDTAINSGYLSRTRFFRPASLNLTELRVLAAGPETSEVRIRFSDQVVKMGGRETTCVEEFLRYTGGQPLIAQEMLRRLKSRPDLEGDVNLKDVEMAYRLLLRSPPEVVVRWQEDLDKILKGNRSLLPDFRSFVKGTTWGESRFPPPAEQRPLFLSGWLAVGPSGRWGIASEFRAHMARQVLERMAGA